MVTLKDFQDQAARIDEATQNISTYVQGTGMSAEEQVEALKAVSDAADRLTAAIPVAPTTTSSTTVAPLQES